jgi:hypothetical protein
MEVVARDLTGLGLYLARRLSFEGVEQNRVLISVLIVMLINVLGNTGIGN